MEYMEKANDESNEQRTNHKNKKHGPTGNMKNEKKNNAK